MTVYHASKFLFNKPDIQKIWKNRTNHNNGDLGLWCSTKKDWITTFGNHTYELEISKKSKFISYSEFYKICCNTIDYRAMREELIKEYDNLCIVEDNGTIEMLIVLNLDSITNFKLKTS